MSEDYVCSWCEEEYDNSIKFTISGEINNDIQEASLICPDCIAAFYTECPMDMTSVLIERWID